jgi:outer membrane protein assembly complex protein YaeT
LRVRTRPILLWIAVATSLLAAPVSADESSDADTPVVGSLRFEGAHAASSKELAAQLFTTARPFWKLWAPRPAFSEATVAEDADRIDRFYRTLGFFETTTRYEVQPRRDPQILDVTFHIDEGQPVLLAERGIEIPEALAQGRPPDYFDHDLPLVVGERFSLPAYEASKRDVTARAAEIGHPLADVVGGADVYVPRHEALLTWTLQPGPLVRFGEIRFEGLEDVEESLLRPEVTLREGEVYSLKALRETRDNIQSLGLFRSVVALPRPEEAQTAADGDVIWPVDLAVVERPPRSVILGLGYGTDDGPRTQASWVHRNFFGGARRFEASARFSSLERGFRFGLEQPNWLARRQTLQFASTLGQDTTPAYTGERLVAALRVSRPIADVWNVYGSYEVSWSHVTDTTSEARALLDDPERADFLSGMRFGVRRSTVSNELDPQSGSRIEFSVAPWIPAFGSDEGFVSMIFDARKYQPIGSTVLAGRFRVGTIEPFGDTAADAVPLPERFYLGGSSSVRGFQYWGLGPRAADGKPVGGTSFLEGSLELRFPIRKAFGGVVFVDAGSVDLDPHRFDFGGVTYSVGAGVRYQTPLGPLRLDLAHALNPPGGADTTFFHFSIGQAF